ncbi:MAG TPA: chemotaxis protein CheW [Candidatus Acidoferrales bacterium]|nr:chemotaxis protein CheW [Candidatus Acidoferrales bacterium]
MNLPTRDAARTPRLRRSEQVILFLVSHQTFAIAADAVKEIRSTDSLAGAAIEFETAEVPKVRHVIERGRRVCYVVNGCAHFHLPASRPALALLLRQFRVAFLVDSVERIAEIPAAYALPLAFSGEERNWYRGLAYIEDRVIPIVQPGGFLTREQFELLDRLAPRNLAAAHAEGVTPA